MYAALPRRCSFCILTYRSGGGYYEETPHEETTSEPILQYPHDILENAAVGTNPSGEEIDTNSSFGGEGLPVVGGTGTKDAEYGIEINKGEVCGNDGSIGTNEGLIRDNGTYEENMPAKAEEINANAVVENNAGTIENNYATVETNTVKGTIENNGIKADDEENVTEAEAEKINATAVVEVNEGKIEDNYATIEVNQEDAVIEHNYGIVKENNSHDSDLCYDGDYGISVNYGTVEINNGVIQENRNIVNTNTIDGEVFNDSTDENIIGGTVEKNYGVVRNAKLNEDGTLGYAGKKEGGTTYYGVTFGYVDEETGKIAEVYDNQQVAKVEEEAEKPEVVVLYGSEIEAREGYEFVKWEFQTSDAGKEIYTDYVGQSYTGGEVLYFNNAPIWFNAVWNAIQQGAPVAVQTVSGNDGNGYVFTYNEDDQSMSTGTSFLIKRDKASLMLINFGEYYLVEGEDYEVVENGDSIVINFLPAFFEKYERDVFEVSMLFNGSVLYTLKVTRPEA